MTHITGKKKMLLFQTPWGGLNKKKERGMNNEDNLWGEINGPSRTRGLFGRGQLSVQD